MQYAAVSGTNSSRSSVLDDACDAEASKVATLDVEDSHDDLEAAEPKTAHESLFADVRGLAMLKYSQFYELFLLVGMLTGIGLMTIK